VKTFEYKGFDLDGRPCKGLVEALDTKGAREKLSKTGILAKKVTATGTSSDIPAAPNRKQVFSTELRGTFYRELGSLLRAGVPITRTLEIIIESPESGVFRTLLAGVRDDVREGVPFAEALAQASGSVTPFETALISVGERSGALGEMVEMLAGYVEEQQYIADRVKTALIYPAIVIFVAVVVATAVFTFVLPSTNKYLVEMNIPIPAVTRFLLGFGRMFVAGILPVAALIVGGLLYARYRIRTDVSFRRALDRFYFGLPLIGRGRAIMANLRFSRSLSVLLRGGVPLLEGVELSGHAVGSSWIEGLMKTCVESVRNGSSLADAVRSVPPLASSLPGWIQAGEASGELESLLAKVSERYDKQWERFITRSLGLIEPVIILILGGFVFLVAVAILMPIMAANQILQFQ
jgi:general secretion pathway protein F